MLKKYLIIPSLILSICASITSFIPYIAIYKIIESILMTYPDLNALNQSTLYMYGAWALAGVLLNLVLYGGER